MAGQENPAFLRAESRAVSAFHQMVPNLTLPSDWSLRITNQRDLVAKAFIVASGVLMILLPASRQQRRDFDDKFVLYWLS